MEFNYYLRKIKDVNPGDYLSIFPMCAALLINPFFGKKYKGAWAVCERQDEAKDNGYHFFKYMREKHPEINCVYAIDKKCRDYRKVEKLGRIIQYGSVEHWLSYFNCRFLISSQSYKPNGYLCTLFERLKLFRPEHVFLQHGITINKPDFLQASRRLSSVFIAGALPEYDFIRDEFGYPEDAVIYTGFARFDALHQFKVKRNRILIMPTWRKWLTLQSEKHEDVSDNILNSEYIEKWREFLQSRDLEIIIKEYNLEVIFYPHPGMKGIIHPSMLTGKLVKYANPNTVDLQQLMRTSEMIITDYSSVFFDMVYMKKPVLFYQFDLEQFRKYHYAEGWFDYTDTAFGKSCKNSAELIKSLESVIEDKYAVSNDFLSEHTKVFALYDSDNCRRIFEALKDKS